MELTIDDCLAIAGRECATEHELRAAVCVAVGQALHYRYEASGYSDAAETAKRDADRARAEARAYSEALIAKDSAPDTSDGIDYPARAEVWKLREPVDALRSRAERAEAERDAAVQERDEARSIAAMRDRALTAAVQEREAFSLRLSAAERERDEARAERDAALARPTYEARTVAPTEEERRAHIDADGAWLVVDGDTGFLLIGAITQGAGTGSTWIPLGADGLPCAWPVPSAEVTP